MANNSSIDSNEYGQILGTITSLCENSKISAISIYWQIGKHISEAAGRYSGKNEYASHLIRKLSEDLSAQYGRGFSATNLKNMRAFSRQWAHDKITPQIDWSNYVTLLTVENPKQRNILEQRIIRESLTNYQLRSIIEAERVSGIHTSAQGYTAPQLAVTRGSLYTYKTAAVPQSGTLAVDCGFSIYRTIHVKNSGAIQSGLVQTGKKASGYTVLDAAGSEHNLCFYRAYIHNIIDADTIHAVIDCGFDTTVRLKLRLRGIDAPELGTAEGERAAAYVKKRLARCPVIGIKTWKNDKYGRYLADIFYLADETDAQGIISRGAYLNQELLDAGLALKA